MRNLEPVIRVKVDPANPGQFFACCGLLELAARLYPESAGRFERQGFLIETPSASDVSLAKVLESFKGCAMLDESIKADEAKSDAEDSTCPITLDVPFRITLDWWSDKSLKTWAGSMNATLIFKAMRAAIDHGNADPFNQLCVVYDPPDGKKPKKREPFYVDARRGGNAKSLDIGFAPDAFSMPSATCPAVESLCMIGLQRFRPKPTDIPRVFDYCTWSVSLPSNVAGAAACGLLPDVGGERFRFENAFRTDQRKHKGFLPATKLPNDGEYNE